MPDPAPKAIFLSYARDDAAAARRIAEALRSSGLEVWFDENELRGGDAWDRKIRKQIDECALFVPLVSQHTEARAKGYFRLEWKLAVDQTQMLAEGVPFIAPVAIDDTRENGAAVPTEFLRVQWTRLPGALPTPQFVEQMKRLLDAPRKATPATRAAGTPVSSASARGGIPKWVWAAAVVVIGGVATFIATRPSSKDSAPPAAPTKPAAATAPVSEVRQLVAKARALYEPWDLASNEDFALAEQLLQKATTLDPADGEAWAASAILSCAFYYARNEDRQSAARSQGERAIKLAPDSDLARLAYAFSLRTDPNTLDECVRRLRDEAARQPGNRMVLRMLGNTLSSSVGQHEQALVYFDKAIALPGRDALTIYNRAQALLRMSRYPEAEAAADEALALAPAFSNAHAMKLTLLVDYHGDMPKARQHLEKVPPDFYNRDVGVAIAAMTWLYSREGRKCLDALRLGRDYIRGGTGGYIGPKAYLAGLAHRMLGNEDAARTEWQAALKVVEKQLDDRPNAPALLADKTLILAALKQRAETEPLLRELVQRTGRGGSFIIARVQSLLGQSDDAIASLDPYMQALSGEFAAAYRNHLRYHPEWDALRSHPRFQALLKTQVPKR
jgi:tetratricopeptide (TPR) repeat protein